MKKYKVRRWSTFAEKRDKARTVERSRQFAALLTDRLRAVGRITVKING